MRKVSKTNSHKHTDMTLRNEYANTHQLDEIVNLFPEWVGGWVMIPLRGKNVIVHRTEQSNQIHHVGSGFKGNPRLDTTWNLCALSQWTHAFCENTNGGWEYDGFVLCRYAKVKSGTWDEPAMAKFLGCDHTLEWVSTKHIEHEFARVLLNEMEAKESLGKESR